MDFEFLEYSKYKIKITSAAEKLWFTHSHLRFYLVMEDVLQEATWLHEEKFNFY